MILLDNCVAGRYVRVLREFGYVAERSVKYLSDDADDKAVIDIATQLDAVLLTTDMDFSNILIYPPEKYQGIIIMRYKASDEGLLDIILKTVLTTHYRDDLRGKLVIISNGRYRIRESWHTDLDD